MQYSPQILRLQEQRKRTWEIAKAILDRADREKRNLSTEEDAAYLRANADLDALDERLEREMAREERDRESEATFAAIKGQPVVRGVPGVVESMLADEFRHRINSNSRAPIEVTWESPRSGYQPGIERRDLLTSSGGGLQGTTFYHQLVEHLVDSSAVLAAGATLISTDTGEALKVPKTTAMSTAAIVAEGAQIGESDPTFASTTLDAYKYGFMVQVSYELANDSTFDLLGYLAREAGQAIGNGAGADFMAGNGTGKPNGLVGAASAGKTGATGAGGAFTAEDLIDLYHSVAEPYARSRAAAWVMRNSTLGVVRKLRDDSGASAGTGGFLFDITPPPGSGAVGTLLGRPVYVDPNVPAVGTGAKSVLFGDMSRYWVRQVRTLRFERSDEYAFDRDLITFRGLWRADGDLIDTTGAVKAFTGGAS
ncbi:phage major capsid protein [Actinomadura xylanilytica]|uniref:phage major capsid protein n=1 Tax=Actinomadura xylanilytica TaxID=887459 RepID=UPI00255B20B2|nr:phage major capsid protein [Actinomadura xylanilytica]MDL4772913.1 phage major capsid protein [Actinomadura xylanilytica]